MLYIERKESGVYEMQYIYFDLAKSSKEFIILHEVYTYLPKIIFLNTL
jgi:hypothetical protein